LILERNKGKNKQQVKESHTVECIYVAREELTEKYLSDKQDYIEFLEHLLKNFKINLKEIKVTINELIL